jgi:hypothetical protein
MTKIAILKSLIALSIIAIATGFSGAAGAESCEELRQQGAAHADIETVMKEAAGNYLAAVLSTLGNQPQIPPLIQTAYDKALETRDKMSQLLALAKVGAAQNCGPEWVEGPKAMQEGLDAANELIRHIEQTAAELGVKLTSGSASGSRK